MKNDEIKLSSGQKNFHIMESFQGKEFIDRRILVIGSLYYVDNDDFSPEIMEKAYFEMLNRNESFRMKIVKKRGKVRQVFQDISVFPVLDRNKNYETISDYLKDFQYILPPQITIHDQFLVRAELICCKDGSGGLVFWQHHICSDGYSTGIIAYQQLNEFYELLKKGEPISKPKKLFHYKEYNNFAQKTKNKKAFFWALKEYNTNLKHYRMPYKAYRGKFRDYSYNSEIISIDSNQRTLIEAFLKEKECSDTALFISALSAVVYCMTKAKRFMITSESHGRSTYAHKQLTGALIVDLPVFCDFSEPINIEEYIKRINWKLIQSSMYLSHYSIVEREIFFSKLSRLFSRSTSKDYSCIMFNNLRAYEEKKDNTLKLEDYNTIGSVTAITLELRNDDDRIVATLKYLDHCLTKEEANIFGKRLLAAINFMMKNSKSQVDDCIAKLNNI